MALQLHLLTAWFLPTRAWVAGYVASCDTAVKWVQVVVIDYSRCQLLLPRHPPCLCCLGCTSVAAAALPARVEY